MAGSKSGGLKAKQTNLARHGANFYHEIGRKGGLNGHSGGFAATTKGKDGLTGPERARIAGRRGGQISRRSGVKNGQGKKRKVEINDYEPSTSYEVAL